MPSCNNDEAAQPCASAYELNEVGDVALEFEVIPENAQVNEVKIIGENRAFEAQGFTSKGGGKWLLNARVTDFTQIKQENTVILSVRQTGGAASEVELVVTDPYTIENKFTLANPKGFNYYSADKENLYETGLPVVIAAEKQEDLALIDSKNIKVVDGAVSHKVGAVHFNIIPMTEETGFTLNVNPEKLEEVQEAIPTYSTLDFNVQLTAAQANGADLLFLPIYYTPASAILTQANAMGYAPTFFGVDGMDGILTADNFDASLAEGVYLLTPFSADAEDELTQNFVSKYQEAYGEIPNQFGADAYDAIYTLYQAIQAAGATADMSNEEICDALIEVMPTLSITGLTSAGSEMTWDENGAVSKDPAAVIIENGTYVTP